MIQVLHNLSSIGRLVEVLKQLDFSKPWRVSITEHRKKRTVDQNSLYWLWLTEMRNHIQETIGQEYATEDLHDLMRDMFLPRKVTEFRGKTVITLVSTTSLNVQEFSDYLEKIDMYCADKLNLNLTHPEDLYMGAMGR